MVSKIYDLAVPISSYTTNDGQNKKRYENIGSVVKGDNGPYILLKRSFNPAGVPFKEGSDCIIISLFKTKEQNNSQQDYVQKQDFDKDAQFNNISDCPF